MQTRSEENKTRANELIDAIMARKKAAQREARLKSEFKALMGEAVSLTVEGVAVITLEEKARSFFDQKSFAADHGQELLDSYKGTTEYQQLNIISLA